MTRQTIRRIPPRTQKPPRDWMKVAREVEEAGTEEDPKERWCLIGEFSASMGDFIRKGNVEAFLANDISKGTREAATYMERHWQVTTVTISKRPHRVDLYMRIRKGDE